MTIAIRPSIRARDGRASKDDLPDEASGIWRGGLAREYEVRWQVDRVTQLDDDERNFDAQ